MEVTYFIHNIKIVSSHSFWHLFISQESVIPSLNISAESPSLRQWTDFIYSCLSYSADYLVSLILLLNCMCTGIAE